MSDRYCPECGGTDVELTESSKEHIEELPDQVVEEAVKPSMDWKCNTCGYTGKIYSEEPDIASIAYKGKDSDSSDLIYEVSYQHLGLILIIITILVASYLLI